MTLVRSGVLGALLVLFTLPALAQQVVNPEPLAKDHPRAKRAAEVVSLLMEKDRAAVEAFLKQHGAASYAGSAEMKEQLDRHLPRLKARKYRIDRFDQGLGSDVVVFVRADDGKEENVVVQMQGEAPYKITGLRQAMIERG